MSREVLFHSGDLIEWEMPAKGMANVDGPVRVRSIILGFLVAEPAGDPKVSVWMRTGRMGNVGMMETDTSAGAVRETRLESKIDPHVMAYDLHELLQIGFERIKIAPGIYSMDPFIIGGGDDASK